MEILHWRAVPTLRLGVFQYALQIAAARIDETLHRGT
jgi:hypothetical protein